MTTDKDIHDALTAAYSGSAASGDTKLPDMNDATLRQLIGDMFKGKLRWTTFMVWIYIIAFTIVWVLCAVMFFATDPANTKALIAWASGFLTAGLFIGMLKMWFWMAMNRNMLAREVKRLELRIAELQDSQSGPRPSGGVFT
jgi:uncharacterized membrane protein YciS (DUF1049 family)